MPNVQHFEVSSGENVTLTLYARDRSNNAVSLTGKTVAWRVGRPPNKPDQRYAEVSKTGTVTSASAGIFTVPLTPSDTEFMEGDYLHQAFTTDGSSNVALVTTGRLRIRRDIEAAA